MKLKLFALFALIALVTSQGMSQSFTYPNANVSSVTVTSSALPTGASTAALQTTGNGILTTIDADLGTVAGAVSGTEMQCDIVTSALPTGAATAANQSTGNGHLSTIAGAISGSEAQVDVVTSALPTGAATASNQSSTNSLLTTIDADTGSLAGTVSGSEQQVDVVAALPAGDNNVGNVDIVTNVAATGRSSVELSTNDHSSTAVTTSAYVELIASTSGTINQLLIFDSSGEGLILATGAAASETDVLYIPPGGMDYPVDLTIASGTRVSVKALTGNTSSGDLIITGLN